MLLQRCFLNLAGSLELNIATNSCVRCIIIYGYSKIIVITLFLYVSITLFYYVALMNLFLYEESYNHIRCNSVTSYANHTTVRTLE